MGASILTLKIKRYHPGKEPSCWDESFKVETRKGMNLLEGLLWIQEEQDPTLSFRYSCRGAVCGSCGMEVDGKPVLACRTPVEGLLKNTVRISPLSFFPVIRDLVVDMSSFFENYEKIEPFLHEKPSMPEHENIMAEDVRKTIDPYIQCILCGICFAVCPAFRREASFLGPAILAKAFRFLIDPRDRRGKSILQSVDHHQGVWGCNTVFRCVRACPKEVPPTHAIVRMRGRILKEHCARLFSRFSFLFHILS